MPAPIRNLWLGIGVFLGLFTANGLAQAPQAPQPPMPRSTIQVDGVDREVITDARGWQYLIPIRLPESDVVVEVIAPLPVAAQVTDVTYLLGRRQVETVGGNQYLTTIAELIMLVEPNPSRPPGGHWKNITQLTISFDEKLKTMRVEYCVDKCKFNKKTRVPHPKRKMVAYSAPQEQVLPRLEKRRAELAQYRDPAAKPQ